MKMFFRRVEPRDADMLLEWRNDVDTRRNSLNMDIVAGEAHHSWLNHVLLSNDLFFILQVDDEPVGYVRVSINGNVGKISYSIAPEKRGLGYGKQIINMLERYVYDSGIKISLLAEVKKENIASRKIFINQGYVEKDIGECCIYIKEKLDGRKIEQEQKFGGVIFLTNNFNTLALYDWISAREECLLYSDAISIDVLRNYKPQLIVSYNYSRMISSDVIQYMHGQCINLHISLLPWNRGSDPNIWSFLDDTLKGVTIHRVDAELDTGDIIFQQEISFDEDKETLATSYQRLQHSVMELFKAHWLELLTGQYETVQQNGAGTYHRRKDLKEIMKGSNIDWNMKISDFMSMLR